MHLRKSRSEALRRAGECQTIRLNSGAALEAVSTAAGYVRGYVPGYVARDMAHDTKSDEDSSSGLGDASGAEER